MAEQPIQYSGTERFEPSDWKEFLQNTRPGGAGFFSCEDADDVLVGDIPAAKLADAIRTIVGYSYASGSGSSSTLNRVAPVRHPHLPFLYAKSVAYEPLGPQGNTANANNAPYNDAVVVTSEQPANADGDAKIPNMRTFLDRYGRYQKCRLTIKFWQPPFTVIGNDANYWNSTLYPEWTRFTSMFENADANLEVLSADNVATMRWCETTPAGPPNGPVAGDPFPGYLNEYISKTNYILKWWYVPLDYVENNFRLEKILKCVGRVNQIASFDSFPAGTLLLQPPKLEKYRYPVVTISGNPLYFYHITLPLCYFDPDPAQGVSAAFRGHNLMPFRSGDPTAGGPAWLAASRDGTPGTPSTNRKYRYLPSEDFDIIFEHVLA